MHAVTRNPGWRPGNRANTYLTGPSSSPINPPSLVYKARNGGKIVENAPCRLVGYLRVSTDKQGENGLGMEAQMAAIQGYAKQTGCELLATYTEVESGRVDARRELVRALAHAKRSKATLVIAKLDRLSRDVHFLSGLMKGSVPFVACDNPNANELTVHILAAVAQSESKAISERTKAALRAYKARGGLLGGSRPGCRNLTYEARKAGAKASGAIAKAKADEAYRDIMPIIVALKAEGLTQAQIADRLNASNEHVDGKRWSQPQVSRLLKRSGNMA